YNLTNRKSESVLTYCEHEGVGFIPWYPVAAGRLAKPGGAIDRVATAVHASSAQVAVAWLLQRSPVMLPIPGTSSLAPLEAHCAAALVELTGRQVEELNAAG